MSKDNQDSRSKPAQIPLLEDVVFNTSLPLKTKPVRRPTQLTDHPRTNDLFTSIHAASRGIRPPLLTQRTKPSVKPSVKSSTMPSINPLIRKANLEFDEKLDVFKQELDEILQALDPDH